MADYALPLPQVVRTGPPARRGRNASRIIQIDVGSRSAWFYGTGVAAVMDELQVPRMRDWHPERKGVLMCPVDRVDDVLALLEHRDGRVIELAAVDR